MSIPHRWSFPADMQATYAFLFDSHESLHTQMSEDVWRLVYDEPPCRDRSRSWLTEMTYVRQRHLQSEISELDAYRERLDVVRENAVELEPAVVEDIARRQEAAIRALENTIAGSRIMHFPPPTSNIDYITNAPFQVQTDSFLCSIHAFNNLARAVLAAPPDMLSAIECLRTLDEQCAAPEDVQLMALREGVMLLPIKLTDVDDADGLAPHTAFHQLLDAAGGMIVYQPNGHGTGHYVPLVRVRSEWLVYSTNGVVVRTPSAEETLHTYIAYSMQVVQMRRESASDARRRTAAQPGYERQQFIGLLPLPLDCLWAADGEPMTPRGILTRSLARRALSEWRLVPVNNGAVQYDLWSAAPLSPCAVAETAWVIGGSESDGELPSRCTGREIVNVASFISTRHTTQRDLADFADRLLAAVFAANRALALDTLRQMRSYLLATPAIDCLFTALPDQIFSEPSSYAYALMSNRRWMRQIVLLLATTALVRQLESTTTIESAARPVLRLFALLATPNMLASGVQQAPIISTLVSALGVPGALQTHLPWEHISPGLARQIETRGLRYVLSFQSYDASLWLLRALPGAAIFVNQERVLRALGDDPNRPIDTNHFSTDNNVKLLRIMRSTLFKLPYAGASSGDVARDMREQWAFETEALELHNAAAARRFVQLCGQFNVDLDVEVLNDIIDVLAFDRSYLDQVGDHTECAIGDDDARPRLLERAARAGFAHIHWRSFGRNDYGPDGRNPALRNPTRVSLPNEPDRWYTARIISSPLAVGLLRNLPREGTDQYGEADYEALPPRYKRMAPTWTLQT